MPPLTQVPPVPSLPAYVYPYLSDEDVNRIATIAIFPPLGIARLGDSQTQFFIGPELPINNVDGAYQPIPQFRDADGHIRRQVLFLSIL